MRYLVVRRDSAFIVEHYDSLALQFIKAFDIILEKDTQSTKLTDTNIFHIFFNADSQALQDLSVTLMEVASNLYPNKFPRFWCI